MLRLVATGLSLAALGVGFSAAANQDPVPAASAQGSVAWVYSVPPPRPEPERRLGSAATSSAAADESLRKTIARLRSDSDAVVDGYQRAMEACRFESTLHFDDPDQSTLVGNDQPCRGRYWSLIRTEQRRLADRIRELRGERADLSLYPQEAP